MEFHVTENEKQDIRQIPNIKASVSKSISSQPYRGNNIEINLPDANSELAQIKVDIRNKVDRSEIAAIQSAEATRQMNEQTRQNLFNTVSSNETDRVASENERKANEATRQSGFQTMNNQVNATLDETRRYVSTLQTTLMNYIDNSVLSNTEIDKIIENALK